MKSDCDGYVAAVMTVRNEADLLAANLAFHRYVGIDRFYIYLDDPEDRTGEAVAGQSGVSILRSALPRWLTEAEVTDSPRLRGRVNSHHTARQVVNCHDAIRRARCEGVSWLVSIDPDELVLAFDEEVRFGSLASLLNTLPSHVESVTFPTSEVIPTKLSYENVFAQETLFKRRYGYGEGVRLGHAMRPVHEEWRPQVIDRIEYVKKLSAAGGPSSRQVVEDERYLYLDTPAITLTVAGSRLCTTDWYIGHVIGKQAFRVDRDVHFDSLHTVRTSSKLAAVTRGRLLHYNCYSYPKFLAKYLSFRDHPNSYAKGSPVDEMKLLLRDLVNHNYRCRAADLLRVYETQICFSRERISAVRDLWPSAVQQVDFVADAFKSRLFAVAHGRSSKHIRLSGVRTWPAKQTISQV